MLHSSQGNPQKINCKVVFKSLPMFPFYYRPFSLFRTKHYSTETLIPRLDISWSRIMICFIALLSSLQNATVKKSFKMEMRMPPAAQNKKVPCGIVCDWKRYIVLYLLLSLSSVIQEKNVNFQRFSMEIQSKYLTKHYQPHWLIPT